MEITFDDPYTHDSRGGAGGGAGGGTGGGDPSGSGSHRARWIAGVAAAMLIAAAAGVGYGIGRDVGTDDGGATTAAQEPPPETTSTAQAPPSTEAVDDVDASTVMDAGSGAASSAISASGGLGWSMFGGAAMSPVFERATDDGYTLRAHLGEPWEVVPAAAVGEWQPAPWCYESAQIRVALAGNGVIDVGSVPWYREPFNGRAVSVVGLGAVDGNLRWVVVAQTPPGTTGVTVTFEDGSTDATAPQNDIAVLSVPGTAPTAADEGGSTYLVSTPPSFDIVLDGPDGTIALDSDSLGILNDPEFRASCEPPPPALPAPGEQPADPAAAEAEIVAAMTALYDSSVLLDKDVTFLDDPTGVAEARAQVAEGSFSNEASSSAAVVEELAFTSPSEAWFRYRIDTDGVGLTNRYGVAVVVDGVWKITRSTVCQDLSMAGGDCGSGWETIWPPGAEDMYGNGREILIED